MQRAVRLGDEWPFGVDVLWAVQVEPAPPYGVCPEVFSVESKLNVAQRNDDASRGLGHWSMAKKLPGRIVGRFGLFRLAKRLESKGEEDRSHGIDTIREHCGRTLGGNLRENNTTFNSNRALGQVLTGELRSGA